VISFANDIIGILTGVTVTDHGNTIVDWTSPTAVTQTGCRVQPLPGSEQLLGRDEVVTRWRLLAPADAPLTSTNRIRWAGVDYEIDGSVQAQNSPTGSLAHLEALLKRVDG
jgi:hypothetical protein